MSRRDPLLDLPPCPLVKCSKCGSTDTTGWISRDWGCKQCSPENEMRSNLAAATGERPS